MKSLKERLFEMLYLKEKLERRGYSLNKNKKETLDSLFDKFERGEEDGRLANI